MAEQQAASSLQRFIMLYALAWAGGVIAYMPLLTLLLPARVAGLAGKAAGVDWLACIAVAGAIAASAGGILFGYLSDVTRNRRGWIAAGLALSCVMLVAIGNATTLIGLIAAIVAWQMALNMMLGPLAAYAGDIVPDDRKGLLGGMIAFAPVIGALSGVLATYPGFVDGQQRLWLVAALVVACVLPVLVIDPPAGPRPDGYRARGVSDDERKPVTRMWLARVCVQLAEVTLFTYLYFWLLGVDPDIDDSRIARLLSAIVTVSAPVALAAGRWSDRTSRPIAPLRLCALISAAGLLAMALAGGIVSAMAAYAVFGLASAVFLALHSTQTLRILPRPERRGRDLGLFNLANTGPSLVVPWVVVALLPAFGFQGVFVLLAALAALAGVLLAAVPSRA